MFVRRLHLVIAVAILSTPGALRAQQSRAVNPAASGECALLTDTSIDHTTMDHAAHHAALQACGRPLPTMAGQAAYAAISEVVRLLKADSSTDWSRVNIEALRQHLIDMDEVTLHATVVQHNVPGGIEIDATGTGRTAAAIKRMAVSHARMLDQGPDYHAAAAELPNGARITVTAKQSANARMVAQIRGLGFAGLLTEGDHHTAHHIALARGEPDPHGH